MSFKTQLKAATSRVQFFDPKVSFTLGQKAYMAGFEKTGCPFSEERERLSWIRGWEEERNRLTALITKWRASDREVRR